MNRERFDLVSLIENHVKDVRGRLGEGLKDKDFLRFEDRFGMKLPNDLKKLYSYANGENDIVCAMMGFEWMSLDNIIKEYEYLTNHADSYNRTSPKDGMIKVGSYKKNWIPFGADGSGSFLLIDLDPDAKGTIGQIITLDNDYDESYVLADSLESFMKMIEKAFETGDLRAEEEAVVYVAWKSGHIFNDIEDISL